MLLMTNNTQKLHYSHCLYRPLRKMNKFHIIATISAIVCFSMIAVLGNNDAVEAQLYSRNIVNMPEPIMMASSAPYTATQPQGGGTMTLEQLLLWMQQYNLNHPENPIVLDMNTILSAPPQQIKTVIETTCEHRDT